MFAAPTARKLGSPCPIVIRAAVAAVWRGAWLGRHRYGSAAWKVRKSRMWVSLAARDSSIGGTRDRIAWRRSMSKADRTRRDKLGIVHSSRAWEDQDLDRELLVWISASRHAVRRHGSWKPRWPRQRIEIFLTLQLLVPERRPSQPRLQRRRQMTIPATRASRA